MSKPQWAQLEARAYRLRRAARMLDALAAKQRCPFQESGGIQCTADTEPAHDHRYEEADLP